VTGSDAGTIIAGCTALLLAACAGGEPRTSRPAESAPAASVADSARPADQPTVVFLGTSLTAGLGLDPDSAYPAVVQRLIDSAGRHFTVVNAGVSGESSAGALRRIDWILKSPPAVLVIETGANDGLRGQNPDSTRANIQAIIDRVRTTAPRTRIILAGMEAPPNLGLEYVRRFRTLFPDLARANHITLIPFLLYRVGGVDSLNQPDGIHPNAAGARIVAQNVWKVLEQVLP